jgi:hypothetical protein
MRSQKRRQRREIKNRLLRQTPTVEIKCDITRELHGEEIRTAMIEARNAASVESMDLLLKQLEGITVDNVTVADVEAAALGAQKIAVEILATQYFLENSAPYGNHETGFLQFLDEQGWGAETKHKGFFEGVKEFVSRFTKGR